jgi:hypothetical protein
MRAACHPPVAGIAFRSRSKILLVWLGSYTRGADSEMKLLVPAGKQILAEDPSGNYVELFEPDRHG